MASFQRVLAPGQSAARAGHFFAQGHEGASRVGHTGGAMADPPQPVQRRNAPLAGKVLEQGPNSRLEQVVVVSQQYPDRHYRRSPS
jgi:hypothetical protein